MKHTALIVVFILTPVILFPQNDQMTVEQVDAYFGNKISIDVYEIRKGERYLVEPSPEALKWQAYQGEEKISEVKLYRITGYENEADTALNYHAQALPLLLFSPLPAVGSVLLIIAIAKSYKKSDTERADNGGEVILFIPIVGFYLSFCMVKEGTFRLRNNRYTYAEAEAVMDAYNAGLLKEIREK